ncbi:GMP synthase [Rhodococcus sp. 15-725-2-2b]|uniref:type 1 glutamine amidotransferase n=1 Tax=unclassified Rhodococcus (in: high G+C Gram-positive bacteria) TaxID=192944 RepID=UPI000B9A98FB|nr:MULTISPECIES: type 1 glutamine amidotransferase [unclassified Rhodococcus (in: high G+C Gram-positive bacteria)]OZC69668.1 GMP synthase [Rhodococcus sp. 06-469-3-2]OZD45490.1 GMP synthase [Rhodococcus sp. 06-1477-1A]OZE75498.1 GMP synthase [Rhodococcus sp. 15-725-2-2b]
MTYTNDPRAVVLVHDRDPALARRDIGTLDAELRSRGFQLDVHSFDHSPDTAPPSLSEAQLLVVMGSPDAAYDDTLTWLAPEIAYVRQAVDAQVPILGVCFGGQLLARVLGGSVRKSEHPEYGFVDVESSDPELVAAGPWMEFHGDTFVAPPEATVIARNGAAQQAFVHGPHLGLQFHPEIDLDTYDAWAAAWDRDGVEHEVDVHEIRRAIADAEPAARLRCSALLDSFLARASAVPR